MLNEPVRVGLMLGPYSTRGDDWDPLEHLCPELTRWVSERDFKMLMKLDSLLRRLVNELDAKDLERDRLDDELKSIYGKNVELRAVLERQDARIVELERTVANLEAENVAADDAIADFGIDFTEACGCGYIHTANFPSAHRLVSPCAAHWHLKYT